MRSYGSFLEYIQYEHWWLQLETKIYNYFTVVYFRSAFFFEGDQIPKFKIVKTVFLLNLNCDSKMHCNFYFLFLPDTNTCQVRVSA